MSLFKSFAYFSIWDYAQPISLLNDYVQVKSLTPYERLVGQVNLVAALVHERRHGEVEKQLPSLLEQTKEQKLTLLYGNILELSAQNAIFQGNLGRAERFLAQAEQALEGAKGTDLFYVQKWRAIIKLLGSANRDALSDLEKIRYQARDRQNWETIRDCDSFEAIKTKNTQLAQRVYFGTPFESYRVRFLGDYGNALSLPSEYKWQLGPKGKTAGEFDVFTGWDLL